MLANAVKETTTTTGTGALTLSAVSGFVRFAQAFAVGALVQYGIQASDGSWEWGVGTVGSGNTLARTLVSATYSTAGVYTTNGATALSLPAGTHTVFCAAEGGNWAGVPGAQETVAANATFGDYIAGGAGIGTTTISVNTRIMFFLFHVARPCMLNELGVFMNVAAAAGATARVGIYAPDVTGYPAALLADVGDITIAATGYHGSTVNLPIFLPPGIYWTAVIQSVTGGTFLALNANYLPALSLGVVAATGHFTTRLLNGQTYGPLPSTVSTSGNANVQPHIVYAKTTRL